MAEKLSKVNIIVILLFIVLLELLLLFGVIYYFTAISHCLNHYVFSALRYITVWHFTSLLSLLRYLFHLSVHMYKVYLQAVRTLTY